MTSEPQPSVSLEPAERVRLVEQRRQAGEGVLWQLPSVTVAAQAFLLAAGLDPKATSATQIFVGAVGIFSALATGVVVAFQSVRLTVLSRWVDEQIGESLAGECLATHLRTPLNGPQQWILDRKGALEAWVGVLVVFIAADAIILAKGL